MKKAVAFLLAAFLLVTALCAAAFAEESENAITVEEVSDQAFAVAFAWWLNEPKPGEVNDFVYWDAAGWYAAMRMRVSAQQTLTFDEAEDFLRSIGYEGGMNLPPSWEQYEIVRVIPGAGGRLNYDFRQHKEMFDAMLGVTTEFHVEMVSESACAVTITNHTEAGEYSLRFLITFAANPVSESRFRWRVERIEEVPIAPEMDDSLDFDWDLLMEQNSLSLILSMCPAIRIGTPQISEDACTWIFLRNGKTVLIDDYGDGIFGTYDRFSFDVVPFPDGRERASVGYYSYDPLQEAYTDATVQDLLKGYDRVRLDHIDGNLVWLEFVSDYGYAQSVAVDRGTLFVKEIRYIPEGGEPLVTAVFDYGLTPPEFSFLKGWDGELRTVTAIWEDPDTENGGFKYRTETILLPYEWEYYPYAARYGEYAAYLDPRYVTAYSYPGDVYNYTVYFTSAKG